MPDSSTPEKSGRAGAWIMTTDQTQLANGGIYSYDKECSKRVWEEVINPKVVQSVLDESLELLGLNHDVLSRIEQDGTGDAAPRRA